MQNWEKIKILFKEVVDLPKEKRNALLDEKCKDNPGLKNEVLALLDSAEKAENYWEVPPLESKEFNNDSADYLTGKVIDKYKIENKIGEGGMAVVYSAVRNDYQFNRRVAIKFIKRGMDTNEIIKRFKIEQQALAGLDHPFIGKIFDGGITSDGIQFFVMEYIDGIPITDYCDKNKLAIDKRLELFMKVCSAVNYAHQNLIIHRDLKPSNILITSKSDPKLLDFGIAKILAKDENLNTSTLTEVGTRLMTIEYASPEQVIGEKITTSSDVYSLGVLLYELLTGHPPYKFKNKLPNEVEKIITSVNPEKPSNIITRSRKILTEDGAISEASAEEISSLRSSNVEKLKKRLSGEMDNIILMALRKDPARRYISVQHLSEDINRYIEGRPVTANRDSFFYRTNKFVKRHKIGVAATILFFLLTISSMIIIIYQIGVAKRERDKANLEASRTDQINNFLKDMLYTSDPLTAGKNLKLTDVLNQASQKVTSQLKGQPEIEAEVRSTFGQTYQSLGLYDEAIFQLGRSLQIRDSLFGDNNKVTAISYDYLALAYHYKGVLDTAKYLYEKSIKLLRSLNDEPDLEEALNDFGTLQIDLYDFESAKMSFEESLKISLRVFGKESRQTAVDINNLALVFDDQHYLDSAEVYYNEAIKIDTKLFGDTSVDISNNLNNLAFVYREKGNYNKAKSLFTSAYDIRKKILGEDHPDVAVNKFNVGSTYYYLKDYSKAEQLIDEAINTWKGKVNNDHYYFANAYAWLGKIQNAEGKYNIAYSNLNRSLQIRKKIYNDKNSLVISTETQMGISLIGEKKLANAEKILLDDYNKIKDEKDFDKVTKKDLLTTLVELYTKWGKKMEAKKYSSAITAD